MQTPNYDWMQIWTAEETERELNEFKFAGPGWYTSKGSDGYVETLLVVPAGSDSKYLVCCYYHDAKAMFEMLATLPEKKF